MLSSGLSPSITQLRALQELERAGTFTKAASSLGKSYTAVNYALSQLESDLDLKLLDRTGYRTKLTPQGYAVLEAGRAFLEAQEALVKTAQTLKSGWEPSLSLVYDGIIDIRPVMRALKSIQKSGITTRITTQVAFHEEVESEFVKMKADLMITLSPPRDVDIPFVSLPSIRTRLVAARGHTLVSNDRPCSIEALAQQTLVTVKGSSIRLGLSTLELERQAHFTVSDFTSKKAVILEGIGYGWLPEYLIKAELRRGELKTIVSEIANEHRFMPRLYHKPLKSLGKSGRLLLEGLRQGV